MEIGPAILVVGALGGGALLGAWAISARSGWRPAGPLVLLAAAPIVPTVPIGFHLSTDDLLPLVGLGLLILEAPRPRLTRSALWRIAIAAVLVATLARIASSIANTSTLGSTASMLAAGAGRPIFLLATAAYVAGMWPDTTRRKWVVTILAAVGTFEAAFSLIALVVPHPLTIAMQPLRPLETLGGCPGRLSGTLGLSANHLGAVFVLTLPLTLGLAIRGERLRRWAWSGAAALQGAALVLTFTRSSFFLGVGASLLLLLYHRKFVLTLVSLTAASFVLLVVTSLVCGVPPSGPPNPTPTATPVGQPSATPAPSASPGEPNLLDRLGDGNDRLALWYTSVRLMLDHPWFGVGIEQERPIIMANPERYVRTPFGVATNSAHNTILLAGAETGVAGALATLVLNLALGLAALIWILRGRGERVYFSAAGFALLAYLGQGMANNLFTVPATSILLAVLVGAFATGPPIGTASDADDR